VSTLRQLGGSGASATHP